MPNTSISLIPPGPSTMEFVSELAGVRGRQSFELSVKKASESIYVVSEGTKLTYRVAKNISSETNEGADAIRKYSRENSTLIVYRSSELGKNIIGGSWDLSNESFLAGQRQGRAIIAGSRVLGDQVNEKGTAQGMGLASGSVRSGPGHCARRLGNGRQNQRGRDSAGHGAGKRSDPGCERRRERNLRKRRQDQRGRDQAGDGAGCRISPGRRRHVSREHGHGAPQH